MRTRIGIVVGVLLLAAVNCAAAGAAPVSTPFGGWNWGSPRPQGNTLGAIGAGGAGTYAVGKLGTILRSADGGKSWSGIRTATRTDLRHVSVVDANSFAAAGGCLILRSNDGGRTLRQRRLPCGSPITALDFPTGATGYVTRRDGSVLQLAASLGSAQRTPLPASAGRPRDIACTNTVTCVVAAENALLRTTDGGSTWTRVHPAGARGLSFVGAGTGYAVGPNRVLKTTDGGETWTPQPPPHRTLVEVSCGDVLHCVVVARSHVIRYTADGFATLNQSRQVDDITAPVFENTVAFTSASHVVAAGEDGSTRTSDDGGLGFDRGYISPFLTTGVDAGPERTAYAFGRSGSVARTTDGGRTWQPRTRAPAGDWAGWFVPDLDSDQSGMAAIDRKGRLFRSSDGAGSWQALGRKSPPKPRALWMSGDGKIVMVGGAFGLLRSTDAGGTFKEVWPDPVTEIEAAGDRVFVIGPGAMIRSTDGGASFTELGVPGSIAGASFPTTSLGFAATRDGRLWRTRDSGDRWREVLGIGALAGAAIGFRKRGDGSIEGSVAARDFAGKGEGLGWLLHTSDGGATWRPQLLADDPVDDLDFVGKGGATALAGSSHLFWTTSGGDAGKPTALSIHKRPTATGRLRVVGRLTPAHGKQKVFVSWRRPPSAKWHVTAVRTSKKGRYAWTAPKLGGRFVVVARWLGNLRYRGAGSKHVVWHPPQ
ncbi:MAG TPA: hypothetical protein VJT75_06150 [Thermoleophilaceae bacterium]|nr:hypothetical protein [Thermoleophilaceae bacterium]